MSQDCITNLSENAFCFRYFQPCCNFFSCKAVCDGDNNTTSKYDCQIYNHCIHCHCHIDCNRVTRCKTSTYRICHQPVHKVICVKKIKWNRMISKDIHDTYITRWRSSLNVIWLTGESSKPSSRHTTAKLSSSLWERLEGIRQHSAVLSTASGSHVPSGFDLSRMHLGGVWNLSESSSITIDQ